MASTTKQQPQRVAIIGGGPAGLMAAEVISQAGISVDLYEAMPSVGRKFLIAGKGGMNLSNAESMAHFITRYGNRQQPIAQWLHAFSPDHLRAWCHSLGIDTFVGSSGRIFPHDMKAAPLLRAWLHRLRAAGVRIHVNHRWLGWAEADVQKLLFAPPNGTLEIQADAVVFALGGGSWAKLGSTGAWVTPFLTHDIPVTPLAPTNCGFNVHWSAHFSERFAGHPLKSISARATRLDGEHVHQHGEMLITSSGIEGGLIYALSAIFRDALAAKGSTTLLVDLLPQYSEAVILRKLMQPKGKQSFSNYLRKTLAISGVKIGLLREALTADELNNPERLSHLLKALPIPLLSPRPLDEAISSAGGVSFDALNNVLMLKPLPGVFCAGEMLDWEAPTGGYLLTACLASGRVAGNGVLDWLAAVGHD